MVKIALLIILACGFLFNGRVFGQESFPKGSSNPMIEKVSPKKSAKKNRAPKKRGSKKSAKKVS